MPILEIHYGTPQIKEHIMKFTLSFKTPDVTDQLDEDQKEEAETVLKKFLEYSEYVCVEFDTETMTATVVPQ